MEKVELSHMASGSGGPDPAMWSRAKPLVRGSYSKSPIAGAESFLAIRCPMEVANLPRSLGTYIATLCPLPFCQNCIFW